MQELNIEEIVSNFLNQIRSSNAKLPWEEDVKNKFLIVNKTLKNNIIITLFIEYPDHTFDIVFLRLNKDSVYFTSDFKDVDPSLSHDDNIETIINSLLDMASPNITHNVVKNDEEFLHLVDGLYLIMKSDNRVVVNAEADLVVKFNILDYTFPDDVDESIINFVKMLCDIH